MRITNLITAKYWLKLAINESSCDEVREKESRFLKEKARDVADALAAATPAAFAACAAIAEVACPGLRISGSVILVWIEGVEGWLSHTQGTCMLPAESQKREKYKEIFLRPGTCLPGLGLANSTDGRSRRGTRIFRSWVLVHTSNGSPRS